MSDLTTAQRLATYRAELIKAGFGYQEAWELVESAAPSLYEDIEIQADLDGPAAKIGAVTVYMRPQVDEDSLAKVADEIKWHVKGYLDDADV